MIQIFLALKRKMIMMMMISTDVLDGVKRKVTKWILAIKNLLYHLMIQMV